MKMMKSDTMFTTAGWHCKQAGDYVRINGSQRVALILDVPTKTTMVLQTLPLWRSLLLRAWWWLKRLVWRP